ncbi:MAG: imelysin family protein [Trueperaceae bacterium]|nr:imelysin family protein [Trueperaceae bacterium]
MKIRIPLFLCLLIVSLSHAQSGFDRHAMLENIALNVVLPCHERFVQAAIAFEEATERLASSANLAKLETAQAAWKTAGSSWAHCELFQFGGLEIMILHNQINKRPNLTQIANAINSDTELSSAFIESQGSSMKGLAAAELLLFSEQGNDAVLNQLQNERQRQFLLALAQNLSAKAQELVAYWSPTAQDYASKFAAADGADGSTKGSINMTMNQLISLLEQINREKLATPLGGTEAGGTARPETAEAYLSQSSSERIVANLEGAISLFTGANGLGIDDYLDSMDQGLLASQIIDQLDAAREALQDLGSLEDAVVNNPERVSQIFNVLKNALVLTSVDAANQLGITVTFNDADGD